MRHQLHTDIGIDAPPEAVWAVLTDLESYADWNPFVVSSQGTVAVGERLVNRLQQPGGKAMTFRPRVTVVEQHRVFEWLGRLGLAFNGVLVRFMRRSLDTQTVQGFEAMNQALKARVERSSGTE